MKRIIALMLIVTVITLGCVFGGCDSNKKPEETTAPTTTAAVTTVAPTTTAAPTTAEPTTTAAPTTAPPDTSVVVSYMDSVDQAPLYSSESVLNVLLIGTDGNSNYGRSDTMMLISLDSGHGKIKMTSILRDTYVTIPGNGTTKLNAAYAYGGADLCIETIEYNFGIDIDAYAIVNFRTFRDLINSIGGVDVELTQDEIDYINAQIIQNNQSNLIESGAGVVHLTGNQALWHARNRGGTVNGTYFYGSDWDRVDRQQRMFTGIINGLRSASLEEINNVANTALPYVTTSLSGDQITSLLSNALTYMGFGIERMSVPSGSNWQNSYYDHAGSVLEITDWSEVRNDMATFIYENIG